MLRAWMKKWSALSRVIGTADRPRFRLGVHRLEERCNPSTAYLPTDLVSDQPGVAPVTDPNLVNAWGISFSSNSAFWVSSNGKDLSTLYTGDVGGKPLTKVGLEVAIPGGAPTGQVFNTTTGFPVTDGTTTKPAVFIFASEAGEITGWNPAVPPPAPSHTAEPGYVARDGAVYKGLALANNGTGNFLYAADFHNDKIDVLDSSFHLTHLAGSFTDPNLPKGYAPFNIASINGKLYVTYAKQDADRHDDVAGAGHGFIDVFDTNGNFEQRLVSRGDLNSPWGLALAPATFGQFGGDLLVGNFGDGKIHAYDPNTGKFQGTLSESPGHPIVIDGLWGLAFGNGSGGGDKNTLYYSAGPDHESHGLFGKITANPAGTNPVSATLSGSDLVITGSRQNDVVTVGLDRSGDQIVVRSGQQVIGRFDTVAVGTIRFNGYAGDDFFAVDRRIDATVVADGGAGNDIIIGGGGSNIEIGGPGNDVLIGGPGRDILIGGTGQDLLFGGRGDDILIGGTTAYDSNPAALLQILNTWNSTASYNDRVAAIRAGTGGVPKLDATTVFDDGVRDFLIGGPGLDWYFGTAPDVFIGRTPADRIN